MDEFKKCQLHQVGIGGMKCPCCNGLTRKKYNKKDKAFNRIARARLKMNTKNFIKKIMNEEN